MMLVYPRIDQYFDLYPDSCDVQIGCFLTQNEQTLRCFSRKMNAAQLKYPMTDKELLAIYEGLKHFDTIIRGGKIQVHCDHKNLTFGDKTVHVNQRVLRQKIEISDEYGAEIIHIDGDKNTGGDGMSRLPTKATTIQEKEVFLKQKLYTFDDIFPLDLNHIKKEQESNEQLKKLDKKKLSIKEVHGVRVKTYEDKVYVPKTCRDRLIEWYHEMLQHRGKDAMTHTIGNDFKWPGWTAEIGRFVSSCDICQRFKITGIKSYGKVPMKDEEQAEPWETIHIDLAGPWKMTFKVTNKSKTIDVEILAMTIIDEGTGIIEIWPIKEKSAANIAKVMGMIWLCKFPRPKRCIHDNGGEFTGIEFQEMLHSYNIQDCPTTVKNPQANAIVERIHLTMADILRMTTFEGDDWWFKLTYTLQTISWTF